MWPCFSQLRQVTRSMLRGWSHSLDKCSSEPQLWQPRGPAVGQSLEKCPTVRSQYQARCIIGGMDDLLSWHFRHSTLSKFGGSSQSATLWPDLLSCSQLMDIHWCIKWENKNLPAILAGELIHTGLRTYKNSQHHVGCEGVRRRVQSRRRWPSSSQLLQQIFGISGFSTFS